MDSALLRKNLPLRKGQSPPRPQISVRAHGPVPKQVGRRISPTGSRICSSHAAVRREQRFRAGRPALSFRAVLPESGLGPSAAGSLRARRFPLPDAVYELALPRRGSCLSPPVVLRQRFERTKPE
jgi:hypothetical protein